MSAPYLLVGSPPCTDWCTLNVYLNHPKMDPAVVAERRRKARAHLSCVVKLYLRQLARGAHFLHEHPATATSWDEDIVKFLLARPGVDSAVGHMCQQGMTQVAADGRVLPVRKATRWASSAPEVFARLGRRCVNEGVVARETWLARPRAAHRKMGRTGRAGRPERRCARPSCVPTYCGAWPRSAFARERPFHRG